MSSYTEGVDLRFKKGTDLASNRTSFFFHIGGKASEFYIFVDVGFATDGNSRPWFVGWLIPKYGRYTKAAVVHDKAYKHPFAHSLDEPEAYTLTRKQADDIFYEALIVLECPKWRARIVYAALRVFGGRAWGKHRRRDIGAVRIPVDT